MPTKTHKPLSIFQNLGNAFTWFFGGIWRIIAAIYNWIGRNFFRLLKLALIIWGMVLLSMLVGSLSTWFVSLAAENFTAAQIDFVRENPSQITSPVLKEFDRHFPW